MHLNHILVFLTLLAATNADLPQEVHWKSVLPNTPMPEALMQMIQPGVQHLFLHPTFHFYKLPRIDSGEHNPIAVGFADDKSTSVNVGKRGGVRVVTTKGKPGGTSVNVGKGGVGVVTGNGKPGGGGTTVTVGGKGKGVSVKTGHKGKPVHVGVTPGHSPFMYNYAAADDQLHDNPNTAIFFLESDLNLGTEMNLQLSESADRATFFPRAIADSIPFSSRKLPEILRKLSVSPESFEGESMKKTIEECEESRVDGEDKYCATSLESMVDFSTMKLGKNIRIVSSELKGKSEIQKYAITRVARIGGTKSVACHMLSYAYAVFYCHSTSATRAYEVSLAGADGSKVKAATVCHAETSAWNPKHLAFQVLKVQPGTVPICHFLPENHIVWVKN